MSAAGVVLYDLPWRLCDGGGVLPLRGCLWTYNFEEPLELSGVWLALLGMLGLLSDVAPRPGRRFTLALYALPALWLGLHGYHALIPRLELRFSATPATARYESGVHLAGYRIEKGDGLVALDLYSSGLASEYRWLGYSVTLIDQASGEAIARTDAHSDKQVGWLFAPGQAHIYRQRIQVDMPPSAPPNRALWIALAAWREVGDAFPPQAVLESDLRRLGDTALLLDELVVRAPPLPAASSPLGKFANGFALESVDMPAVAMAGDVLPIRFSWRSDVDAAEDYGQFLHLGHVASGEWFVYDQPPLGAKLPTRLWYAGMADSETWSLPLPVDLASGVYSVFTGLYRLSDKERLPVKDADGAQWLDARVALGQITISA